MLLSLPVSFENNDGLYIVIVREEARVLIWPTIRRVLPGVIVQSYYDRGFDMRDSPSGWVTGALLEAGIGYREIWDTLSYLSQDQVSQMLESTCVDPDLTADAHHNAT